jgi:hypothetical protein
MKLLALRPFAPDVVAARARVWAVSLSIIALGACMPTRTPIGLAVSGPIVADRPGATDAPDVVPRGGIQAEAGYTLTRSPGTAEHSLGEGLLRFGVGGRAEIRVNVNSYVIDRENAITQRGRQDTKLGTKIALLDRTSEGASLRPAASAELAATIPTGDAVLRARGTLPEAKLIAAWQLPAGFGLGANLEYARVDGAAGRTGEWSESTSLGHAIAPWLSAYAEALGVRTFTPDSRGQLYGDGGVAMLLGQRTQLDMRAGMRADHGAPENFFGLGIARRW